MPNWIFTTPVVREAPFSWNSLLERFSMNRGVSLVEVSPCVYEQVRYDAYTQELGAENLPDTHVAAPAFWPQPSAGLNYFRGGYEWVVDDATKACLLASPDAGVTEGNFAPSPGTFGAGGFGEGGFGG